MLSWILAAQLTVAHGSYQSAALRTLIEDAARQNRRVPAALQSYRASMESEIAIVARRAEGTEAVVSVEQVQNLVRWRLPGEFEQRVVGYRSQWVGLQFSALSFLRQSWAVPILYGNRISLLLGRDTSRLAMRRAGQRRLTAVHPLAEDRDDVYRFTGGDTVITMRTAAGDLPIVRVVVEPRADAPERTVAFSGELDIDATRRHLVRMRGHFVRVREAPSVGARLRRYLGTLGFEAIALVELENAEIDGRYWLPSYQRLEGHASWSAVSDSRSVFRIVSRFRDHRVNDTAVVTALDTLVAQPFRLGFARADSLAAFRGWRQDLGTMTSAVHSSDFDDVAPDPWRQAGPPQLRYRVPRLMDAVRLNRIEGLFTGWGVEQRFRDRVPGLTLQGNAGWSWREAAVRGRARVELARSSVTWLARGGRSLDITNDFRSVLDSGTTLGALFTQDNYDYVDRRSGAVGLVVRLDRARSVFRLETGPARDAAVQRHLTQGPVRSDSGFRENRGVRPGSYWRTWGALEWHPDVGAEFMRTGVGGQVTAEHARGTLEWTRVEARVMARQNYRSLTLAARLDGGVLLGDEPPPQQLFELGSTQNLLGYGYKEFVGNRSVVGRALAMYHLPVLRAPLRLGRFVFPGVAPALAAGTQAAWSELEGGGAIRANADLLVPLSRPTGGVRTSVTLGVRVVGDAIGLGFARPVDRGGPWRFRVDFARPL